MNLLEVYRETADCTLKDQIALAFGCLDAMHSGRLTGFERKLAKCTYYDLLERIEDRARLQPEAEQWGFDAD